MNLECLTTDEGLLWQLADSARKPLSRAEVRAQRISFVFSIVGHRGVMRADIQKVLAQQEGI
ncbi:MAG: hypothetical protein AAB552_02970 [Patescibacteria group bacterium]